LFRLRQGIHLQPCGIVLVRRGNRAAADACRWQRLPVPRFPAEDGWCAARSVIRSRPTSSLPSGLLRFARN